MARKIVATPICDVCDRLTIARLKYERLPDSEMDKALLVKQVSHYTDGIDTGDPVLLQLLDALYTANARIWDAESELRAGYEDQLTDAEIVKRAKFIRDENRHRVAIKNAISMHVNEPEFVDCKMNHLSAE